MKLCFIILAHDQMDRLEKLLHLILSQGCMVCLHLDKKVPQSDVKWLKGQMRGSQGNLLFSERVACSWGTWSLVEAVLKAIEKIDENELEPDYVYLISGADIPIQPISDLKELLKKSDGNEFIESFDNNKVAWIKDGLTTERYTLYFPFNFQAHRWMFDFSVKLQRRFKINRVFPKGYAPHFGSQWWCLTWKSLKAMHAISKKPDIRSFFKSVWIPDELIFQTLIRRVVPENKITNFPLTFYRFNHQGKPILIYQDQLEKLTKTPYFFARKLSNYEKLDIYSRLEEIQEEKKPLDRKKIKAFGENTAIYENFVHQENLHHPGPHRKLTNLSPLASLEANKHLYFIIFGAIEAQLVELSHQLNDDKGIVCHQRLFCPDEIQLTNVNGNASLYRRDDIALREYHPPSFLYNLIHHNPDAVVGFCCMPEDFRRAGSIHKSWLSRVVQRDRNCKVIVIENNLDKDADDFHGVMKERTFLNEVGILKSHDSDSIFTIQIPPDVKYLNRRSDRIIAFIKKALGE